MTKKETRFTNLLRSRGVGCILAVVSAWMTWRSLPSLPSQSGCLGLMPELSCMVNYAILFAIAVAMVAINRSFTLLRTLSIFFAAFFLFICASTPIVSAQIDVSSLLAATVILCMWILFTIYNERRSDRRIFLIFCLLGAGSLYNWIFLFYIPLFILGIGQMRILRFKKIMAAIIGLITPAWIAFGLDLLPLPSLPDIYFTPPSLLLSTPGGWPFLCTVLFSMIIGFIFGSTALLRILGFNARARAYNGFLAALGIYTGILAIVNFTALSSYVTLLNACVAFQVGHFFRATATRRGYIVIMFLLVSYSALYVWSIS